MKTTLGTSGKYVEVDSKRVERYENTLETSVVLRWSGFLSSDSLDIDVFGVVRLTFIGLTDEQVEILQSFRV